MLVCLRRLLRWSHLRSSSERSLMDLPLREGPVFAFSNVMSRVHGERPEKLFPGSTLLWERHQVSMYPKTNEKCCIRTEPDEQVSQWMHFLYWSFYVNMKNQHFFSWSRCYLGVLSKWHFSLCPSECMLYECVTMNSLCIFTWRKKKTAQGYRNPRKRLVQLNLYVIN